MVSSSQDTRGMLTLPKSTTTKLEENLRGRTRTVYFGFPGPASVACLSSPPSDLLYGRLRLLVHSSGRPGWARSMSSVWEKVRIFKGFYANKIIRQVASLQISDALCPRIGAPTDNMAFTPLSPCFLCGLGWKPRVSRSARAGYPDGHHYAITRQAC